MILAILGASFSIDFTVPQIYIVSWQMQYKTHTYLGRYFRPRQYKDRSWGEKNTYHCKVIFKEKWKLQNQLAIEQYIQFLKNSEIVKNAVCLCPVYRFLQSFLRSMSTTPAGTVVSGRRARHRDLESDCKKNKQEADTWV